MQQPKLRPCRPGDVLAREEAACGAWYEITVGRESVHPASGVTNDRSMSLGLTVSIPAGAPDNDYSLRPSMIDETVEVLNAALGEYWGYRTENHTRTKTVWQRGDDILAMERELRETGIQALQTIQAVEDRHVESVRQQEAARAQQYARRMVEDTEPTEAAN